MVLEGSPALLANIQRLRAILLPEVDRSPWNQAQHLFARTRAVVPYLTGELYSAAYIANISPSAWKRIWVVGYDTVAVPHAMIVHETPNRVHPTRGPSREPKQDHYLSEPRDAMEKSYPREIADDMRDAIHRFRARG
jgi:hypothetical protein